MIEQNFSSILHVSVAIFDTGTVFIFYFILRKRSSKVGFPIKIPKKYQHEEILRYNHGRYPWRIFAIWSYSQRAEVQHDKQKLQLKRIKKKIIWFKLIGSHRDDLRLQMMMMTIKVYSKERITHLGERLLTRLHSSYGVSFQTNFSFEIGYVMICNNVATIYLNKSS